MDKITQRRWHNMLVAALADKTLEPEEKAYLESMRQALGLSQDEANAIVADYKAKRGGIELSGSREERVNLFRDVIRVFLADGVIQPREERFLQAVAKHLQMGSEALAQLVASCRAEAARPSEHSTEKHVVAAKSAPTADAAASRPAATQPEPTAAPTPKPEPELEPTKAPPPEVQGTIQAKTGIELISIPAGTFVFGDMSVGGLDEKKQVEAFQIGKHAVTHAQWLAFEKETGHQGRVDYGAAYNRPRQPVVGVSLDDAFAFCAWAGLRLPTEAEWERAGRGTDGRRYAWGNDYPNAGFCNYGSSLFDDSLPRTNDVGSHPHGMSPAGCHDMAGNVDEWCFNGGKEDPRGFPIRGANWLSAPYALNIYYHNFRPRETRANTLGFRVAADA